MKKRIALLVAVAVCVCSCTTKEETAKSALEKYLTEDAGTDFTVTSMDVIDSCLCLQTIDETVWTYRLLKKAHPQKSAQYDFLIDKLTEIRKNYEKEGDVAICYDYVFSASNKDGNITYENSRCAITTNHKVISVSLRNLNHNDVIYGIPGFDELMKESEQYIIKE